VDFSGEPPFDIEAAAEGVELRIGRHISLGLIVYYTSETHRICIVVSYRQVCLVQAIGIAFASNGQGMRVQFRVPRTTALVRLTCEHCPISTSQLGKVSIEALRDARFPEAERLADSAAKLREQIRAAFGTVPFPSHLGLRAAVAADEWVSDPIELARITAEQDVHGEWWEIPREELLRDLIALTYLDAAALEFYLPAYMTLALNELARSSLRPALELLEPPNEVEASRDGDDRGMLAWRFREVMSRIVGDKHRVAQAFLTFLRDHLEVETAFEAREKVAAILQHPYWRTREQRGLGAEER
jgi:hypothetical protein